MQLHRAISIFAGLVLATPPLVALAAENGGQKNRQPLPKKVEFELAVWDARLGLGDRQMRELRHAARGAVAELKAAKEAAENQGLGANPWEGHKSDAEPWKSLRLPRALRAKSFTTVAAAVLNERQLTSLAAFKNHLRHQARSEMQSARAHLRTANLTRKLSLTEAQIDKLRTLLENRARSRRQLMEKFKGREDQIPPPVSLRSDPTFIELLDTNQKKRLKKKEEGEEEAPEEEAPRLREG